MTAKTEGNGTCLRLFSGLKFLIFKSKQRHSKGGSGRGVSQRRALSSLTLTGAPRIHRASKATLWSPKRLSDTRLEISASNWTTGQLDGCRREPVLTPFPALGTPWLPAPYQHADPRPQPLWVQEGCGPSRCNQREFRTVPRAHEHTKSQTCFPSTREKPLG